LKVSESSSKIGYLCGRTVRAKADMLAVVSRKSVFKLIGSLNIASLASWFPTRHSNAVSLCQ